MFARSLNSEYYTSYKFWLGAILAVCRLKRVNDLLQTTVNKISSLAKSGNLENYSS